MSNTNVGRIYIVMGVSSTGKEKMVIEVMKDEQLYYLIEDL